MFFCYRITEQPDKKCFKSIKWFTARALYVGHQSPLSSKGMNGGWNNYPVILGLSWVFQCDCSVNPFHFWVNSGPQTVSLHFKSRVWGLGLRLTMNRKDWQPDQSWIRDYESNLPWQSLYIVNNFASIDIKDLEPGHGFWLGWQLYSSYSSYDKAKTVYSTVREWLFLYVYSIYLFFWVAFSQGWALHSFPFWTHRSFAFFCIL